MSNLKWLLVALVLLVGCGPPKKTPPDSWQYFDMPDTIPDIAVGTITHEGHRLIVVHNQYGVAIILHPDDGKAEKPEPLAR